mmetsp:Transcript_121418/g.271362  ORF Transcript_121418/g.271362 Transcript_121418/m.271362 type:complete len:236 (+) Transcript_121418:478-1185(+)
MPQEHNLLDLPEGVDPVSELLLIVVMPRQVAQEDLAIVLRGLTRSLSKLVDVDRLDGSAVVMSGLEGVLRGRNARGCRCWGRGGGTWPKHLALQDADATLTIVCLQAMHLSGDLLRCFGCGEIHTEPPCFHRAHFGIINTASFQHVLIGPVLRHLADLHTRPFHLRWHWGSSFGPRRGGRPHTATAPPAAHSSAGPAAYGHSRLWCRCTKNPSPCCRRRNRTSQSWRRGGPWPRR